MKLHGFIETFKDGKFVPWALVEMEDEDSILSLFGKSKVYFNSPHMALPGKPIDLCPEIEEAVGFLNVGNYWTLDVTWPLEFLSRNPQLYHKVFDSFVDCKKLPVWNFVENLKLALEDAGESRFVVFLED